MFGNVVMGTEKDVFEHIIHEVKKKKKVSLDIELTAEDLKALVDKFKAKVKQVAKRDFPQDP
jgi:pyruvate,orthophosphate dikinase